MKGKSDCIEYVDVEGTDLNVNVAAIFYMFFGITHEYAEKADFKQLSQICVNKAYRDLCRTVKYGEITQKTKDVIKENTTNLFVENITKLNNHEQVKSFTKWHRELCKKITKVHDGGLFSVGQAQKWINMTLKYLRMMGVNFGEFEAQMHIPIDNYIIEAAKEPQNVNLLDGIDVQGLDIPWNQDCVWSKCNSYEKYLEYQNAIKDATQNMQLEWEEKAWEAMAIRHSIEDKEGKQ